ncbi:MAG: fumarylacetoacetate hydrolase family protein [Lachnospiraceae bacterium]|nr:fumarylacetoacetate hydrolase family protein [Lachnospiraceae bacterium]
MKLYTVEVNNQQYVAAENRNKKLVTLDSMGIKVKDMNELIVRYDELRDGIGKALAVNENAGMEAGEYRIKAPIPVPWQDVICLGVNYRAHIEETVDVLDFTKKADTVYFSKRVNTANDPDGMIPVYDFVDSLDYEAELGVILKKDALNITVEEAAAYIFGYTIINDVSARNLQFKHQQWYRGKSLDGYTPMGPCIVTADEIRNAHDLAISCYVNDEKRQESNTGYMITTVEEAIAELSQGMTLKSGTIIATGTPGGVGMGMKPPVFLKKKDVVKCEIEGIGSLVNTVG